MIGPRPAATLLVDCGVQWLDVNVTDSPALIVHKAAHIRKSTVISATVLQGEGVQ
jgi:hypothetical protein